MGGNPLLLVFLGLGLVLLVAVAGLAVFQRRAFRDQAQQVQELLREARRLQLEGDETGAEPSPAERADPEAEG